MPPVIAVALPPTWAPTRSPPRRSVFKPLKVSVLACAVRKARVSVVKAEIEGLLAVTLVFLPEEYVSLL